jgi:uncharacterized protein (TIGR03000 family)
LLLGAARTQAQPPFYRIGSPSAPVRDPRLTTDNGIPGSGSYYYRDYPWPSLRDALQQYGFCGRRFQPHADPAAAPVSAASPARIRVHLPADAALWFEGRVTNQGGHWRQFVTPPLSGGGAFEYEVEARWMEEGREVRRRRSVRVNAGAEAVVDFSSGEADGFTLPPPRRVEPK